MSTYSFACSACGKCCNSAPAMTLPELFRHRERFVGCIAIGRVSRRREGERLRVGGHEAVLDAEDVAAFEALAQTLLHRTGESFSVMGQGYDYPSLARCPALEADGRCAIHLQGKPVTCEVVPLDPLVPDRLQHLVLAGRRESAGYLGADCLHEGVHAGTTLMVTQGRVADEAARDALMRRRDALEAEREMWGRAVFDALRPELFDSPPALARIASGGFLTISLVPALLTVAGASVHCRDACIDYIDSQLALIERCIGAALLRRRLDDRPITQELRGFAQAYQRAKATLTAPLQDALAANDTAAAFAARVEAYLGLKTGSRLAAPMR